MKDTPPDPAATPPPSHEAPAYGATHGRDQAPKMSTAEPPGTGDDLLTIEQAASRLNMSARYVRRLIAERRIAFHRMGRAVRLKAADVDAFISDGRVEAER